jgi:hypothetical protein
LISFVGCSETHIFFVKSQLFAPLFTALSAKNGTFPSSTEILSLGLELARAATEGKCACGLFTGIMHTRLPKIILLLWMLGELPSNDLLQRIAKAKAIGPLQNLVPKELIIPGAVRDAFATFTSPSTTALSSAGVLPYMNQVVGTLEQIPLLIEEVSRVCTRIIHPGGLLLYNHGVSDF